jgi:hypothetical protein
MSATITLKLIVPLSASPGDYAMLYANSGDGDIDFNTPLTGEKIDLFPDGDGNYGWGLAPWGKFPFGQALSVNTQGWGLAPWGLFPFGYGAVIIVCTVGVADCGDWKFAFKTFDAAGNANAGSPGEVTASVHITPQAPVGLKKVLYDPATGDLTLAVDNPADRPYLSLPSRAAKGIDSVLPGRIGIALSGGLSGSGPTLPGRTN